MGGPRSGVSGAQVAIDTLFSRMTRSAWLGAVGLVMLIPIPVQHVPVSDALFGQI